MDHLTPEPPKRLTRSRDDKVVAGVCGGLARYLNLDPALVRILTVVLTMLVGGAPVLLYVVAVLVVPEDGDVRPRPPQGPRPPASPLAAPPVDPVWGRQGAPWEQPEAAPPVPPPPPERPERPEPR